MLKPSFEKGNILKQNMLESLRDYPRKAFDLIYGEYGEGIIDGFSVKIQEDGCLAISPGIVKIDGEIFFSDKTMLLEQRDEHNYVYIELACDNTVDGVLYKIEVSQYSTPQSDKLELFRYTKNAALLQLRDCADLFNPPINRINKLHSSYSYKGGKSLCPDYFKVYAKEVLASSNARMEDIAFAYECMNEVRDVDLIKIYFGNDASNDRVLEEMKNKLAAMSRKVENLNTEPEKVQSPRKMIVS